MTKLEKFCLKWLNDNFNQMEPFYMEEYPDYIFHMKNGKCILQYNKKNEYVYVSYRKIWNFFETFLSMSNQQIKDVTKIWVEEYYKIREIKTSTGDYLPTVLIEEHYKMGVTSTVRFSYVKDEEIEEHYKNKIQTTDDQNKFYFERDVEELYNQYKNG